MEPKLEITRKLEDLRNVLDSTIAVLNLPAANLCEKRAEVVRLPEGTLEQSCKGCITQKIKPGESLPFDKIKEIIDFFIENYDTKIITINGRGDPFHPELKEESLKKIRYASSKGLLSYAFTAGNNLDEKTCRALAKHGVNVMLSLFGNNFIDAGFFKGKRYESSSGRLQNQKRIADNLRRLISAYENSNNQPENGITRLGMNYVVSENDMKDKGEKIGSLKEAANENGLFFVCNTNFESHPNLEIQTRLEALAVKYSNFHLRHSTFVNGRCQMGAGSSTTVDFDGEMYRCPYMCGKGDGKFQETDKKQINSILEGYMKDRDYVCVLRRTIKQ
jgi:hypothetical protein